MPVINMESISPVLLLILKHEAVLFLPGYLTTLLWVGFSEMLHVYLIQFPLE